MHSSILWYFLIKFFGYYIIKIGLVLGYFSRGLTKIKVSLDMIPLVLINFSTIAVDLCHFEINCQVFFISFEKRLKIVFLWGFLKK